MSESKSYHQRRYREDPEFRENAKARSRAWAKNNRERKRKRERARLYARRYGITVSEGKAMWAEQGGLCRCCGTYLKWDDAQCDHCHDTGDIRGFLCGKCNRGIGLLGDNLEGVKRAVEYLS